MLLSIIIPCFNSARFISHTLDMLISQDLYDCEVIVINDGSTDDTSKIVHSYIEKNSKIKLVDKNNEGVSVARNLGITLSTGKYIYFLDSDDSLTIGTLNYFRDILSEHSDCQMFMFGYETSTNGQVQKKFLYPKYDNMTITGSILQQIFLTKKICCHICSSIYDSNLLRSLNLTFTPGLKIGEDVEFILKYIKKINKVFYTKRLCFVYQIRNDSTMQGYKSYSLAQYNSFEIIKNIMEDEDYQKDDIRKYANFFIKYNYITNLFRYYNSSINKNEITEKFIKDSIYLKNKTPSNVSIKLRILSFIARFIPVKFLLKRR